MQASAGVVGQAELNAGRTSAIGGSTVGNANAHTWSWVWFGLSVAFILFIYFGFGGLRGSVAS